MTRADLKAAAMQELTEYLDKLCAELEEELAAAVQAQRNSLVDVVARQRVRLIQFRAQRLAQAKAALDRSVDDC